MTDGRYIGDDILSIISIFIFLNSQDFLLWSVHNNANDNVFHAV